MMGRKPFSVVRVFTLLQSTSYSCAEMIINVAVAAGHQFRYGGVVVAFLLRARVTVE